MYNSTSTKVSGKLASVLGTVSLNPHLLRSGDHSGLLKLVLKLVINGKLINPIHELLQLQKPTDAG